MGKVFSRRRFLQWVSGAGATMLLAACAPKVIKETIVVEKPIEKVVTVVIAGTPQVKEVTRVVEKAITPTLAPRKVTEMEFRNAWFTEGPLEIYSSLIKDFEAKNPDIKVKLNKTPVRTTTVMTALAGGAESDVIQWNFGQGEVKELASRGALLPIDNLLATGKIDMDDFLPQQWEWERWGGNTWGTPIGEGPILNGFIWHKRYFQEMGYPDRAPKDWPTLVDYAIKLTKFDSAGNIIQQGWAPLGYGVGTPDWMMYLDSPYISDDKRTMLFDKGNWPLALEFTAEVYKAIGVDKMVAFDQTWKYDTSNVKGGFPNGVTCMMLTGSWAPGELATTLKDKSWVIGYDWPPTLVGKKHVNFGKSHSLVLPRTCKIPEICFRWMAYCCSLEANLIMFNIRGANVWSKSFDKKAREEKLLDRYPGLTFYYDMLKGADRIFGPKDESCPVRSQMLMLWPRAREEVIYGRKTAKQACLDLNAELQKALDAYYQAGGQ